LPATAFSAALKLEYPALIGISKSCAGFVLMSLAVYLDLGVTALVAVLVLAETGSVAAVWGFSRRLVSPVWCIDLAGWKEVLRSSLPLGLAVLSAAVVNRIDFIMLERMTDLHQVGLYAAAYKITNLLEAFPLMLMGTIYPVMASYARDDHARLRDLYRKSVKYLALLALPLGAVVTAAASVIVRIVFGAAYSEAGRALSILVWSTVFLYLAISGGNLLISIGRERLNFLITGTAAVINILLNLLWIPRLGYIGAALATAVTFFVIFVATVFAVEVVLRHPLQGPTVARASVGGQVGQHDVTRPKSRRGATEVL
jgi:O-antigen/teichoic acid export membrane protein